MKNTWFKHYNTASEGQLIGDLISQKEYEAALLVNIIMELISRFEDENRRGFASIPIDRIARVMNMKPTRIDRLLTRISVVSRSDLICEMDAEQPRNRTFLMRNWLELQETRGGKRLSKTEQKPDRSKKGEVRSKRRDSEPQSPHPLFEIWNERKNTLPECLKMTDKRIRSADERWSKIPNREYWIDIVDRLASSPFCSGENDRKWVADFDFFIKPDTHIKVLEGKYNNKKTQTRKRELITEF